MNEQTHQSLIRKMVANARSIIKEEVGISIGCSRMNKILTWLEPFEKVKGKVYIFRKYDEESMYIPSGTARLYCSKEAFQRYDAALNSVNLKYRTKLIEVCFEIIENYSEKKDIKL